MNETTTNNGYIIYIRVSTQKQGNSGLGLEAQQKICNDYIVSKSGVAIATYKDVESGTHRDRQGLWDAINHCKQSGATLVIAKLDRLARDVEFTFRVINSGIDIHFCDMPVINTMILGVFASVAQYERELTSKRTKDALEARRAKGLKMGNEKGYDMSKAVESSARARTERAKNDPNNIRIWGLIGKKEKPTQDDFRRYSEILNNMNITTPTGMTFTPERTRSCYNNLIKIFKKPNQ